MNGNKASLARKLWQYAGKPLLLVLLSAAVGTGLLVLSEFLPAEPMDRNLARSADIFEATGKFPNLHTWCSSRLDNYSDAIMLQIAGNVSAERPVEYAMLSRYPVLGELDPVQSIVAHYAGGEPYEGWAPYARYWHGYGVIYRLLLQFLDYHKIRLLNMAAQIALMLYICFRLFRAGSRGRGMIPPLLISWGMLAPVVMGLNLEYSLGFYVSLFSVLAMLRLSRKGSLREKEALVLLFSGICTAYWDVLTYPMAALGLPLAAAFFLDPEEKPGRALARLFRLGLAWGAGYGLMWVSKWLIGTALTGYNAVEEGLSTFLLRTGEEAYGEAVTVGETLWRNLVYFFRTPVSFLFLAWLLGAGFLLVRRAVQTRASARTLGRLLLPWLLIACIPFAWCAVTKNHAYIHDWLASKAFIVTTTALLCGLDRARRALPEPDRAA